jgi:hypothetical protein
VIGFWFVRSVGEKVMVRSNLVQHKMDDRASVCLWCVGCGSVKVPLNDLLTEI